MKLLVFEIVVFLNTISLLSAQKYRSQFSKECGIGGKTNGRIVGGKNAAVGEFPWIARIGMIMDNIPDFFCGGSLITDRHILTAEHCLYDIVKYKLMRTMIVSLGDHNLRTQKYRQKEYYKVSKLLTYKLDETTYNNDIAMLELSSKVEFNKLISPVCLPDNMSPTKLVGEVVEVIGFGLIDSMRRKEANILQKIKIKIKPLKACGIFIEPVGPGQICAGSSDRDSCDGDSGGPLLKLIDGSTQRYTQLGIVSFGASVCENDYPAVYTDVNYYLKWIDSCLDK